MRKPLISLLLACALAFAGIPALSEEAPGVKDSFIMAGYKGENVQYDWSENLFFQRMEERTGISFEYRQYTGIDAWTQEKARIFAGDELPDVLFGAQFSPRETLTYYESGKLVNLLPLLEENAPNLWALLQANPGWLKAITLPDGAVAALPALNTMRTQNAMWINKTWLERLKLDMPSDAASLQKVLEAFKTQDPNRNGKADEVPLAFLGPWDIKFLAHAFGLVANDYNMYADAAGKAQFMPIGDTYREFIAWVSSLYAGGLMDKNGFTTADTLRKVTDENAAVTYGIFLGPVPNSFLPAAHATEYDVLMPLDYQGSQVYRDFLGPVARGTFAITTACKDPAALLRWVDFLYTEEGGKLALFGQADVEYAMNENGTWRWLVPSDQLADLVQAVTLRDSDSYPLWNPVAFQTTFEEESAARVIRSLEAFSKKTVLPFPVFTLTAEQQETLAPMQAAIGRYVDESLARFVLGEVPLNDESWQEYQQTLTGMGLDTFIAFWQQVLDGQMK